MILLFIILSIILEALTDALNYLSWTQGLEGAYHHITQVLLIISIFFIGYFYKKDQNKTFQNILFLLLTYILIRIGLFDLLYHSITNTDIGNTSLWDRFISHVPILQNSIFRLILAFTGVVLYIIKFKRV